ncbi:uncharacterized protein LOC144162329 isoform X1 [Haemaphysalis longicornis]
MEIKLGDRYSCYDDFEVALRRFEKATNSVFVKRSTKSVDIANYSKKTAKLDAKLKFFHAVFTCKRGGPIRTASRGLRRRVTSKRNCPAHIVISARRTTQELEVTSISLEHNHNPFVLDEEGGKIKVKPPSKKTPAASVIFVNLSGAHAGDGSKGNEGRSLLKRNLTANQILENINNETEAAEMLLLSPEQASLACGSNSELAASAELAAPASEGEEQMVVEQAGPVVEPPTEAAEQPNQQLIGLESVRDGGKEHRGWTEEKAAFLVELVKTRISPLSPRIFTTKKAMWEDVAKHMNTRFPESTFTPLNVAGKWKMLERFRKKEEEESRNSRPVVIVPATVTEPSSPSPADLRQFVQNYTLAARRQEESAERRHRDRMALKRKKLDLLERLVAVAEKNARIAQSDSSGDNYDAGRRARAVQESVDACLLLL